MTKIGDHPLIGKWRITAMELWDAEFIDMVEPGYVQFDAGGGGQFVFGAVQGGLDCRYGKAGLRFTWAGFDEMDQASGDGEAQLADDGTLKGTIRFHLGDESSFRARRW
ncbi:MAG: hypothetical protein IT536_17895 [Hyphomicrobiales bacterium]|nr:hypothetical protein [Hyphomicrobiales bacterium]